MSVWCQLLNSNKLLNKQLRCQWSEMSQCSCDITVTWWRHQMETFSALLTFCAGNSPVPGEFPSQRPVTQKTTGRKWLGADQATSHYLNQWWFVYWHIYASFGLNELTEPLDTAFLTPILFCLSPADDGIIYFAMNTYIAYRQVINIPLGCFLIHCGLANPICISVSVQHWSLVHSGSGLSAVGGMFLPTHLLLIVNYWKLKNKHAWNLNQGNHLRKYIPSVIWCRVIFCKVYMFHFIKNSQPGLLFKDSKQQDWRLNFLYHLEN